MSTSSPIVEALMKKSPARSEFLWMVLFGLILIDILLIMIYYIRVLQAPTPNVVPVQFPQGVTSVQITPITR